MNHTTPFEVLSYGSTKRDRCVFVTVTSSLSVPRLAQNTDWYCSKTLCEFIKSLQCFLTYKEIFSGVKIIFTTRTNYRKYVSNECFHHSVCQLLWETCSPCLWICFIADSQLWKKKTWFFIHLPSLHFLSALRQFLFHFLMFSWRQGDIEMTWDLFPFFWGASDVSEVISGITCSL